MKPLAIAEGMYHSDHLIYDGMDFLGTSALTALSDQPPGLDMAVLLERAYDLGDSINCSAEAADYLYWKDQMNQDPDVRIAVRQFMRKKELFEECMRFGHFHPEYHRALDEAEQARQLMEQNETIRRYKQAEEQLDALLHNVAETIAYAFSESVKVSRGDSDGQGGCSSGGCSSGGSCSSCG